MIFYNNLKVAFGLIASIMLFAIMAWMLHDSHPRMSKTTITSPSILELMWISAHSATLQDFMTRTGKSMSDQLRIEGIKTEVCLLNLDTGPTKCHSDEDNNLNLKLSSTAYLPNWQQFIAQGQFSIFYSVYQMSNKNLNHFSSRKMLYASVVLCSSWHAFCTSCDPYPALDPSSRT